MIIDKGYGGHALRTAPRTVVGIIMLELLLAGSAGATILTVCTSGCAYSSIQDAVDASSSGDTILVQSGTYYENVIVTRQLTLRGIGMPVVDANGRGSAIILAADGIILEGFTVTGAPYNWSNAGIKVTSNNNTLNGNNASSNDLNGIYLSSSSNNTLSDNDVNLNNYYGIYLSSSSNNTLSDNNANSNRYEGIDLSGSNNNTLSDNNASNNIYGMYLFNSSNNTLSGNNASNRYDGIDLSGSNNNTLSGNNVSNNGRGIYLSGSNNNTLSGNNASNNGRGIYLSRSNNNNKIYHNNIINNANQAIDDTNANIWYFGYPTGGNYWSDYTGVDIKSGLNQDQPGSDGIGDTPYMILDFFSQGSNMDRYPLMIPFSVGMKGDLNNNGESADAADLVIMKRASVGEIPVDSSYDLNNNGMPADSGDLVLMKRALVGEINL